MLRQDNLCKNAHVCIEVLSRMCQEKLFVHEFSTETCSSEKVALLPFVLIQMHDLRTTS